MREETEEKKEGALMSARSSSFTLVFLLHSYFASIQSLSVRQTMVECMFLYMNISLHFRAGKMFSYFNRIFDERKRT